MSKLNISPHKKTKTVILILISIFMLILNISQGVAPLNQASSLSINFSTLVGGANEDDSYNIIFDKENNIIIAGATRSSDFPIIGGFDSNYTANGKRTGFIAKFSSAGKMLFSTFLGGSGQDTVRGLAVNSNNQIIVAGDTTSEDFPITPDALNKTYGGGVEGYLGLDFCCGDGFLSILSPDLSILVYSSYISGSSIEGNLMLAVDNKDQIIVSGFTTSTDILTTITAFQKNSGGLKDLFVTIFSPNGSSIVYSSYYGGNSDEFVAVGNYLALDENNNIFITGGTRSSDFPILGLNSNSSFGGDWDIFLVKFSSEDFNPEYSTYIGGNKRDFGFAIAVDNDSNLYVTGTSNSENYPLSNNAFQTKMHGGQCLTPTLPICGDGILTLISNDGKLNYSSYLGGKNFDNPQSIILDNQKNIFIAGFTFSNDFPSVNPYQESYGGGTSDYFVVGLSGSSFNLLVSTYIGSSGFEMANRISINNSNEFFITGWTASPNFPVTDDSKFKGFRDVVLMKLNIDLIESNSSTSSINTSSMNSNMNTTSSSGLSFFSLVMGVIIFYSWKKISKGTKK